MIKHIVMWRLKDSAHGNDKATNARIIRQRMEALAGQIPGLLKIEIGIDSSATASSSDIVLYSEFTDSAALEGYQAHPLHRAVVQFAAEAVLERRMVDYEVS